MRAIRAICQYQKNKAQKSEFKNHFFAFFRFFRFFPQILLFLVPFSAFFPRLQFSAVAAKNRTDCASIHEPK